MNWNTNVISTQVTGTLQGLLTVLPTNLRAVTWAFATGECGSENWGGLPGERGRRSERAELRQHGQVVHHLDRRRGRLVPLRLRCRASRPSSSATTRRAWSGIDFDIEAGQSAADDREPRAASEGGDA